MFRRASGYGLEHEVDTRNKEMCFTVSKIPFEFCGKHLKS